MAYDLFSAENKDKFMKFMERKKKKDLDIFTPDNKELFLKFMN